MPAFFQSDELIINGDGGFRVGKTYDFNSVLGSLKVGGRLRNGQGRGANKKAILIKEVARENGEAEGQGGNKAGAGTPKTNLADGLGDAAGDNLALLIFDEVPAKNSQDLVGGQA